MASTYGATRKLSCPVCGMKYDTFRVMLKFGDARREKISLGEYGRRNGTLGLMHQRKKQEWLLHVDQCVDGFERAQQRSEADAKAFRRAMACVRLEYETDELRILKKRRAEASKRHANKLKQIGVKRIGCGRNARKVKS